MKISILISAIAAFGLLAACSTPAPVASAQEQSAPAKPAMGMDMDKQMSRMQEHMQAMQENMKAMRGMGGPMTMGGEPKQRQEMMEKHMNMMQTMMEQMMQHEQMMQSMPAK